jgi:hypothetical protein
VKDGDEARHDDAPGMADAVAASAVVEPAGVAR